jgi:peptidoglycan/LPS O-acetylase OafA/YrhL
LALLAANGWLMQVLPVRADWKLYYLYIDNWWPLRQDVYRPNIIGHFWTLAVEEQFYLAWPMLVLLASRRRLMGLTIALSLTALAIRIYLCWASDPPSRSVVENTFARMDSLLLGALCACVIREPAILARVQAALLPIFGLGIVGAVATNAQSSWTMLFTVGFSLLAVAFSALILDAAHVRSPANELQRFLSAPILRALGKYSYGIYVYHVPLVMFSAALLPGLGLGGNAAIGFALTALIVATSFLVARVSYELLESPFLRLKRYFEPEPAIAMENR